MPIARVLSQAGSIKETSVNSEEVTMLSIPSLFFQKDLGCPGKHQVQAKSVMHPRQMKFHNLLGCTRKSIASRRREMLLLSTDRTSGALAPVLGSPVQNKHRHTGDQQQATNMVRDWSTCHKRMAERAGTV